MPALGRDHPAILLKSRSRSLTRHWIQVGRPWGQWLGSSQRSSCSSMAEICCGARRWLARTAWWTIFYYKRLIEKYDFFYNEFGYASKCKCSMKR